MPGIAAPPVGDETEISGGLHQRNRHPLTAPGTLKSLSVYLGSIDSYNLITFQRQETAGRSAGHRGPIGCARHVNGDQFFCPKPIAVSFSTSSADDLVNQVVFSSSGNSFEFDNIAANDPPARVPEPITLSLFATGLAGGRVAAQKLASA